MYDFFDYSLLIFREEPSSLSCHGDSSRNLPPRTAFWDYWVSPNYHGVL